MADIVEYQSASDRIAAVRGATIASMDKGDFVQKFGNLLKYIILDVGYNVTDTLVWQYMAARISDVAMQYYGHLTLSDVKLAFEFLLAGKLNGYLPHKANGEPEVSHYQNFNTEYFMRVMNAYCKIHSQVPAPVEEEPERPDEMTDEVVETIRMSFLRYKYTGRLPEHFCDMMCLFQLLRLCGYCKAKDFGDIHSREARAKQRERWSEQMDYMRTEVRSFFDYIIDNEFKIEEVL